MQFGVAELLGVLPKGKLRFLLFFILVKFYAFLYMICVWQNSGFCWKRQDSRREHNTAYADREDVGLTAIKDAVAQCNSA